MIKITVEQLEKLGACSEAVSWVEQQETQDILELYELAKRDNHLEWCNWLVVRLMNHEQRIMYAIFAAESVLHIYESAYPEDMRVRDAIKAAKNCLLNSSADAAYAAYDAAYAAYADAAYDAADDAVAVTAAAADAAYAAAYAAYAAAYADADAYAAAYAADYAVAVTHENTTISILDYGLSLLFEEIE